MSDSVYKIFRPQEWEQFQSGGHFSGSVHDVRDGFIHLCTWDQLTSTVNKYFGDQSQVVIAEFSSRDLHILKWEEARGGILFPHVYGVLSHEHIQHHFPLTQDNETGFALPLRPPVLKQ